MKRFLSVFFSFFTSIVFLLSCGAVAGLIFMGTWILGFKEAMEKRLAKEQWAQELTTDSESAEDFREVIGEMANRMQPQAVQKKSGRQRKPASEESGGEAIRDGLNALNSGSDATHEELTKRRGSSRRAR